MGLYNQTETYNFRSHDGLHDRQDTVAIFSIASGGHLRQDEEGRTRVQLLVAIANPPSLIIKYRRRYGVCTRYIASLQAGQNLNIGMQQGYLDVQPSELDVPVVMIGPGTGLAPMRSMIWQRHLWSKDIDVREQGKRLEGDILIFGNRNEHGDYFFRHEWEQLQHTENLAVLTAFSRDKDKPRQYVQDKVRTHGALIRDAILESLCLRLVWKHAQRRTRSSS